MNNWNQVKTTVFMDGNPCPFTTLRLEQEYSGHHTFDIGILCSPLPNQSVWHYEREGVIAQQGQKVSIRMKHMVSGDETIFRGIITGIRMEADEGTAGMLHYKGHSPTVLLDSGKTMDSFTDYTLEEVVREVVYKYGNGVEAVVAPKFPGHIPYLQMHEESGFEFLKRIAYQYDEWFYYDGQKLYFGNPHLEKDETLTYDVDLADVSYAANLRPFNYSRHEYLPEYDCDLYADDSRRVHGINTYLYEAISASNSVFKSHTILYNEAVNNNPVHLSHLVDMEKGRDIADMSLLEGRSNTCRVRVAQPVVIKIPNSMCTRCDLGRYRVMSVVHQIDRSGIYTNIFKGIPASMEHLPVHNVSLPDARPILGKVVNNADPENKGRVQVQFPWQEEKRKSTGWIRVLSPDAGKSEAVPQNRGFVFIPEVDDQVLVAFEGGNSGRPYVLGSLFRGKNAGGGQLDNHIKSITTRSGNTIIFNDTKGGESITIRDKNNSQIIFDTHSKTLTLETAEAIVIKSKKIVMEASDSIDISSGGNVNVKAKENMSMAGRKMNVAADEDYLLHSKTMDVVAEKIDIQSTKDNMTLSSQKEVVTQSGSKKIKLS